VGGTPAEEFIGQMVDEIPDRWDVSGGVETWDGGAPGVIANHAETFVLFTNVY
jgi:hypothetical protein